MLGSEFRLGNTPPFGTEGLLASLVIEQLVEGIGQGIGISRRHKESGLAMRYECIDRTHPSRNDWEACSHRFHDRRGPPFREARKDEEVHRAQPISYVVDFTHEGDAIRDLEEERETLKRRTVRAVTDNHDAQAASPFAAQPSHGLQKVFVPLALAQPCHASDDAVGRPPPIGYFARAKELRIDTTMDDAKAVARDARCGGESVRRC